MFLLLLQRSVSLFGGAVILPEDADVNQSGVGELELKLKEVSLQIGYGPRICDHHVAFTAAYIPDSGWDGLPIHGSLFGVGLRGQYVLIIIASGFATSVDLHAGP